MSWAKLDDMLPWNRKWRRLVKRSAEAGCLWVAAIGYSARYLTDGRVPKDEIDDLVPFRLPERLAAICAEEGMFDDAGDAWVVHDYLDFNPAAEDVLAKQEVDRRRQARRRKAGSANAGRGEDGRYVTPDDMRDNQRDNQHDGPRDEARDGPRDDMRDYQRESRRVSPATRPVPSRPDTSSSSSDSRSASAGDDDDREAEAIEAAIESRLRDRRRPQVVAREGEIANLDAWIAGTRKTILAALARGDHSVLDPPPVTPNGGSKGDPLEAAAAAQRLLAERNDARLRGESVCGKCSDSGLVERGDGLIERCDCAATKASA